MGKELELAIKIAGKVDKSLGAAVNSAQAQLNSISKFTNKAMAAATVAVAAAGAKIVTDSIETYKDYQSAISSAAATGGIERGTADYEALDKAAREAGRTTVKTAKESANALEYMMLAGWSVQDSTKALMPILKLSAATGADLATTSDLVTDSMASLGLGIGDVNHYLDALAKANNIENYSSQELLESFIGVGGVLKNLSVPFEKGAAVLGVMASQGLKGSEAGTALNAILVNMQKKGGDSAKAMKNLGISMYDTDGKARDLLAVLQDVHDKTAGMTQEQRNLMYQMIGGKSHYEDFAKIMAGFSADTESGIARAYELAEAFENSDGALDKLYDIKTDTLEGSMEALKSAYEGMLIDIGERASPVVSEAVKNITNKIPEIEEVIISALERIIPAAEKVLNFLTNNSDKIISGAINMAKAFTAFKIGSGFVKGVNLFKDLYKIASKVGGLTVFKGIAGTFTGISSGAAGATGSVAALGSSLAALAAPLAVVAAGVGIGVLAYKAWDKATYHWADNLEKTSLKMEEHSSKLSELNSMSKELSNLKLVINNPQSSAAEVENAKNRINEIAEKLSQEYNLKINTDAPNLNETAEAVENIVAGLSRKERSDTLTGVINSISEMNNIMPKYKEAAENYAKLKADNDYNQKQWNNSSPLWSNMQAQAKATGAANNSGVLIPNVKDSEGFIKAMQSAAEFAKGYDLGDGLSDFAGNIDNLKTAQEFYGKMLDYRTQLAGTKELSEKDFNAAAENMTKYEDSARRAGDALQNVLSSDIASGNVLDIQYDIEQFENLGKTMVAAGADTLHLTEQFASAKNGFADLQSAVATGDTAAISAMANDMTEFARSIGSISGDQHFEISATGDLSIIDEAQQKVVALNDQGNIDVSVNANGDISIVDEATGEIQTLQGLDAVSLQVNADGNVEVLDKAQQVITTIDSKNAQVSVDGQVYGLDQIEAAKNAANNLTDKSTTQTVTGSFPGKVEIEKAVEYQSKLADVNKAQTVNGSFPGKTDIATAISYQNQLADKSVTYTVTYKQNGTPPAHSATGAYSWRGGLTYVNDQRVADPREVIETNGMRYYYEGKNVLADIPKGARIYTAAESRAFINGSHRNGLERVPFDGYIAELHQGERVLTSKEASEYGDYRLGDYLDMLLELMDDNPHSSGGGDDNSSQRIVFSPNITIYGDADEERVMSAMRMSQREFEERYDEMCRDRRRKAF